MFLTLFYPLSHIVPPLVNPSGGLETAAVHHAYSCGSLFVFLAPERWHRSVHVGRCSNTWSLPSGHMLSQCSVCLTSRGQDSHSSRTALPSGINQLFLGFIVSVFRSFIVSIHRSLSSTDPLCTFSELSQPVFREKNPWLLCLQPALFVTRQLKSHSAVSFSVLCTRFLLLFLLTPLCFHRRRETLFCLARKPQWKKRRWGLCVNLSAPRSCYECEGD